MILPGEYARLEGLDYADDICIMSHILTDMKEKIDRLQQEVQRLGLKINTSKTQKHRLNTENLKLIYIETIDIIGSVIDKNGCSDRDVALKREYKKRKKSFGILSNSENHEFIQDRLNFEYSTQF